HLRLRAGYDFLLLRCASGEIDSEIGEWWTGFMEGDGSERELLLAQKPKVAAEAAPAKKRPRRRGSRSGAKGVNTDSSAGGRGNDEQGGQ
ncbi:MAG: pcnB, partial [Collimonas fungivorans]|nr:pcnB [Collimonas fungivorans]